MELPHWQDREQPNTQLTDVGTDEITLTAADHPMSQSLADWMNDFRVPLHAELRALGKTTRERLEAADINHDAMATMIAQLTDTGPPYPLERTAFYDDVINIEAHQEAVALNFLPENMTNEDGTASFAQFYAPLSLTRLNPDYFEGGELYKLSRQQTYLHILGRAALGSVVDATIPDGDNPRPYTWYGYNWRYDGNYYGDFLDQAVATHLAAIAAEELQLEQFADQDSVVPPAAQRYRLTEGYNYDAGAAMVLDIISQKAGKDIYTPIQEFAKQGRDDSARQEVAAIVTYATNGQLELRELEAIRPANDGLPLNLMERVEDLCEVDPAERIAVRLKHTGVKSAD